VLEVFKITGLDTRFALFRTLKAALDHLQEAAVASGPSELSADAAVVLALAATALPFAEGVAAEAERWLRILRLHGEVGRALSSLGVREAPLTALEDAHASHPSELAGRAEDDPVASVMRQAARVARERAAEVIGTVDVLIGVMTVYGPEFERVLRAYGSQPEALIERLAASS
jgi:hypothetical protein